MSLLCSNPSRASHFTEWKCEALQQCTSPTSSATSFLLGLHLLLSSPALSLQPPDVPAVLKHADSDLRAFSFAWHPHLTCKAVPNGCHTQVSQIFTQITPSQGGFFPWHHILNCSLSTSLHFALYFFIVTLYLFTDLFCLLFVFTHNISYGRAGICLFYSLPSPAPRTVPGTYRTLNNYLLNQWTNCGNWTGERELTFSKRNESPEITQ